MRESLWSRDKNDFFREEGSYIKTQIETKMINVSCWLSVVCGQKKELPPFLQQTTNNEQLTTDQLGFNIMGLKRILGRSRHGETEDSK